MKKSSKFDVTLTTYLEAFYNAGNLLIKKEKLQKPQILVRFCLNFSNTYLINSILPQVILHYVLSHGIGTFRSVLGPLPNVACKMAQLVAMFTGMNFCLFSLAITSTKFCFVCIFRRIPVMDDRMVAKMIASSVYLMTFLVTFSKIYIGSARRIEEKICEGVQNPEPEALVEFPPFAPLVALISILGHFVLSIPIMIEQNKDSYINRVLPFNQQNTAMTNLGNKVVRIFIFFLIILGTVVNCLLQT